MEVNGYHQPSRLVTNILHSYLILCAAKKDIHTGLEQLEGK